TLGLQLITLASRLRPGENAQNKVIDDAVRRAHTLIALRCHLPLDLEGLAKELGVGYSHLRHSFQARTGISLRDHYLNVRLQKSKDLLISSGKSVKEIADLLGFESASHFSKQFKDHLGDAPQHWREKQIKDTGVV
ncbi:MAG TPA: helix-turn-helix transcriptional regulator, partial [Verrucomicrobiae bacterium]